MKQTSQFTPAWWLANRHLQTMAGKILRRKQQLPVIEEVLELPDGDFVELAWTEDPDKYPTKPIVFVLHGLEGSIDSHYAKGMMSSIKARGFVGMLMHFRGCGSKPNRQGPSYHSGDTFDVHYCVDWLSKRFAQRQMGILGFSLGGNVLAKYLAEDTSNPFKCAAVLCAPLHLASCAERINRGFSKVYQKYLVDMLKDSTSEKIKLGLVNHLTLNELEGIKTLYDFDHKVTALINGFESANDYYEKASGIYVLNDIQTPTLVIHALDDPFLCHNYIDNLNLDNALVHFEVSKYGGHVGFIGGNNPLKPQYYLEQRVLDFFAGEFS
ncbi:hydrolase [Thalassotalea crassostreae]|uniref:hydrolase n=1 Tax=Thalassotalea crassostreae TaxID=1763536 RepID=UPI0008386BFF|nr:hydrolase [Thalassotalea crassostreae]